MSSSNLEENTLRQKCLSSQLAGPSSGTKMLQRAQSSTQFSPSLLPTASLKLKNNSPKLLKRGESSKQLIPNIEEKQDFKKPTLTRQLSDLFKKKLPEKGFDKGKAERQERQVFSGLPTNMRPTNLKVHFK